MTRLLVVGRCPSAPGAVAVALATSFLLPLRQPPVAAPAWQQAPGAPARSPPPPEAVTPA